MPRSFRAPTLAAGIAVALLVFVRIADAHDFWLVPDAFQVAEGALFEVRGQTSSRFPTSESAVTPDRVTEARVISDWDDVRVTDVSTSGTSLVLRHRPAGAGQRVVAITLAPRSLRASGPGFKRYMELEGAAALAARYEREGILPKTDSITRRYAKYAKTLVQVGATGAGPRAFARVVGQPVEFVPLRDPSTLRAGDTLAMRLLYNGRPLGAMHVHAGAAADSAAGAPADLSLETDGQGVARVPVGRGGLWNVRTLHIVPAAAGSGADWDAHFATLVFSVGGGSSANADSAAVTDVVSRYHAALASGDSAAALHLLTPDAIILESGGLETRDEYRKGHLPADIAFAAAVPSQRRVRQVVVRGGIGWVASTSSSQGTFRGRAVNSTGAELMVLLRTQDGWRIRAIHWSSRARRP
jgi:ketosteroid isomerase-like protein